MKTAKDPRHIQRREAIKALFADSFAKQDLDNELAEKVLEQKEKIDARIVAGLAN